MVGVIGGRGAWLAALLTIGAACGGESVSKEGSGGTTSGPGGSGGTTGGSGGSGGTTSGSGGGGGNAGRPPTVADCADPLPQETACTDPGALCGGPCVNSWQQRYECLDGSWQPDAVTGCGPHADNPPACRNSFANGALTPCCPANGLECKNKPDGYPGFGCTPGDQSFCSCGCSEGGMVCGC